MSVMGDVWRPLLGLAISSVCVFSANCASSQITPDRTLPNNTTVTINGSVFNITGGTQAGRNLFHSFQQFSVPTGNTAFFNNGLDVQNIFSRVTGGTISNIDGIIKANGTANLFFLNPSGIVFGKNATLNVGGSFLATTANAIQFGNLGSFSASVPDNPALLTVNPTALFYNQINAAASIQNNSTAAAGLDPSGSFNTFGLRVPNNQSLLLVGGDVNLDQGGLVAFGGRVELGGIAGTGTIGLNFDANNLRLDFPDGVPRADVSLTNGAGIIVASGGGGSITINARNVNLLKGSSLNAGIGQSLGSAGSQGGDITVNATGDIKIDGVDSNGNSSGIFADLSSGATGRGGDINIQTGNLFVTNGGVIRSSTFGNGDAGNIYITSSNSISLDASSYIVSNVQSYNAQGNAGNIDITTGSLLATRGSQINSFTRGNGNAGNVTITATGAVSFDGVDTDGSSSGSFSNVAAGGVSNRENNINITADSLSLTEGGELSTSVNAASDPHPAGQGIRGNVNIDLRDALTISGTGSFISSILDTGAVGRSGNINIQAEDVFVTDGGFIRSSTFGKGNAGNLTITAPGSVVLSGESYNPLNPQNAGPGGLLAQVESTGQGHGGDLTIKTGLLSVSDGSKVQAATFGQGDAGNIFIQAANIDVFETQKSSYFTTGIFAGNEYDPRNVTPAKGNGGSLTIDTGTLNITNGGQVASDTFGNGNAGQVLIQATDSVNVIGTSPNHGNSSLSTTVEQGAIGQGGDLTIKTGSLIVGQSQVSTSTFSIGNAGNLTVHASDSVELSGEIPGTNGQPGFPGGLFAQVDLDGVGHGGNLTIDTKSLSVSDGSKVQAATFGQGDAGNLLISASVVNVFNTYTKSLEFSTAINAGVSLDPRTKTPPKGNGGSLTIETGQLNITNGGVVTASNQGIGKAGDLSITAGSIRLDNQAQITSQTMSGKGGNIAIDFQDFLLLQRDSQISTTAGTPQAGGDGGNVNIKAPNGFVVATKDENNEITANAFNGSGGKVQINALGVYNFDYPSLNDLETRFGTKDPSQLDQDLQQTPTKQTPTNNITAISLTNPTLSGQVNIITPDIDPARGLIILPTATENPPKLVSSSCAAFNEASGGNSFTVTGRGGLPPNPYEPLTSDAIWTDTRLPQTTAHKHHPKKPAAKIKPKPIALVPATGWVFNGKGEVTLISSVSDTTSSNAPMSCPAW